MVSIKDLHQSNASLVNLEVRTIDKSNKNKRVKRQRRLPVKDSLQEPGYALRTKNLPYGIWPQVRTQYDVLVFVLRQSLAVVSCDKAEAVQGASRDGPPNRCIELHYINGVHRREQDIL